MFFQGPRGNQHQRPEQMCMDSHKCMDLPFRVCLSASTFTFCFSCFSLPIAFPSSWKNPTLPLSYSFLDHFTLTSLQESSAVPSHAEHWFFSKLWCCFVVLWDPAGYSCAASPVLPNVHCGWSRAAGTQDSVQAEECQSSSRVTALARVGSRQV